jgi:hypothetical protein
LAWLDTLFGYPLLSFIPLIRPSNKLHSTFPAFEVCFPDTYQFLRWKDLAVLKYFLVI